jgi:hypothetical protein
MAREGFCAVQRALLRSSGPTPRKCFPCWRSEEGSIPHLRTPCRCHLSSPESARRKSFEKPVLPGLETRLVAARTCQGPRCDLSRKGDVFFFAAMLVLTIFCCLRARNNADASIVSSAPSIGSGNLRTAQFADRSRAHSFRGDVQPNGHPGSLSLLFVSGASILELPHLGWTPSPNHRSDLILSVPRFFFYDYFRSVEVRLEELAGLGCGGKTAHGGSRAEREEEKRLREPGQRMDPPGA